MPSGPLTGPAIAAESTAAAPEPATEPEPAPELPRPRDPSPGAAGSHPPPGAPLPRWIFVVQAVNFLVLIGVMWLVWHTSLRTQTQGLDLLRQQVAQLDQRLAARGPAPAGSIAGRTALAELQRRVAALEARPTDTAELDRLGSEVRALQAARTAPPADAAALTALRAGLEATRKDVAALTEQVAAQAAAAAAGQRDLGQRLDTLHQAAGATTALLLHRLTADEARMEALTARIAGLRAAAGQTARLARVAAVRAALDAGRPLGTLPDAPPALARYAGVAPPTEAALRLTFPAAAHAALAASRPATAALPLLGRLWARAQSLVTLRQGDKVILGDPAAGILAAAQARLDAGDLAGAVAALARLDGPAAKAMAPWRAQAADLLAARAALEQMSLPPRLPPTGPAPSGTTAPAAAPAPAAPRGKPSPASPSPPTPTPPAPPPAGPSPAGPSPAGPGPAPPSPTPSSAPAPRQAAALGFVGRVGALPGVVRG